MNNYQLKYSKTQKFNTRYCVKDMVGGGSGSGGGASYIETTYSELRKLRDNGQLTKGAFYRITDYTCDVKDEVSLYDGDVTFHCTSAHNDFDLVVLAVAENAICEDAVAVKHRLAEGETDYFANNNLSAWDVKYSLDVDENLQPWASVPSLEPTEETIVTFVPLGTPEPMTITAKVLDTDSTDFSGYPIKTILQYDGDGSVEEYLYLPSLTVADNVTAIAVFDGQDQEVGLNVTSVDTVTHESQGHGVITFLRDEFGNECHYDFKNIKWARYLVTDAESPFYDMYYGLEGDGEPQYFYTFDGFYQEDVSCDTSLYLDYEREGSVMVNVFGEFSINNVFFGNECYSNTFGNECYSNTFGNECDSNTFGNYCDSNTFGNECYYNTFGNSCYSNTFGNSCYYNTFGNYCYYNTFGNECYSNTFGNECYSNTFGEENPYNKLEDFVTNLDQSAEVRTDIYVRRWFYDQNNDLTSEVLSYTPTPTPPTP